MPTLLGAVVKKAKKFCFLQQNNRSYCKKQNVEMRNSINFHPCLKFLLKQLILGHRMEDRFELMGSM